MARSLPCTPASWAEPAGALTAHRQGQDPWEEELEVAGMGHSPLGSAGHTGSVCLSLTPDTAGVGSPGAEPGLALSARLASGLRGPSSPSSSSHLPPLLPACSSPFFLPPLPTLPAHLGLAGAVRLWVGPEGGPPSSPASQLIPFRFTTLACAPSSPWFTGPPGGAFLSWGSPRGVLCFSLSSRD